MEFALFQDSNTIREASLPPVSKVSSSLSIDDNSSLELRDVDQDETLLDELEISQYLVFKKAEEEGPDIRGGHPDAILIHATKANKHGMCLRPILYVTSSSALGDDDIQSKGYRVVIDKGSVFSG